MLINDKIIAKKVGYLLKKYNINEFSEEEIKKITELSISNVDFDNKKLNINLKELRKLKEIKRLTLQNFEITDEIVEILNSLEKLTNLELDLCEINASNSLNIINLKKIEISYCNIKESNVLQFPENFEIILKKGEKFNLEEISNKKDIKKLVIKNAKIKNFDKIKELENLEELYIDGSIVDNDKVLNSLREKIYISHKKNNLPNI